MTDARTDPAPTSAGSRAEFGAAVVVDLDEVRARRPLGAGRVARLVDLQGEDVARTVRVQALERIARLRHS